MDLIIDRLNVYNKKIPEKLLGVYYFTDSHENILYIGKSIDIKKRIDQHLLKGRKRLINTFSKIKIKKLHTELESLLFESQEIKKYRPIFNRRLRKYKNQCSLITKTNEKGYRYYKVINFNHEDSLIDFFSLRNAKKFIMRQTKQHNLCEKINKLDNSSKSCFQYHLKNCNGACLNHENNNEYNKRFEESLENIIKYPKDCKIEFSENKTYAIIRMNKVVEFGVKSISQWRVNYPSNDELRIINSFKNKSKKRVKIKVLN